MRVRPESLRLRRAAPAAQRHVRQLALNPVKQLAQIQHVVPNPDVGIAVVVITLVANLLARRALQANPCCCKRERIFDVVGVGINA